MARRVPWGGSAPGVRIESRVLRGTPMRSISHFMLLIVTLAFAPALVPPVLIPGVLWAQDVIVDVKPETQMIVGTMTVDVTIEWCGQYPHFLDVSTRIIRFTNDMGTQDVSGSFTTQQVLDNPDCQGPDDYAERSTGTITLTYGSNDLFAEIRDYWNYAGADVETWVVPPPERTVVVSADYHDVEVPPGSTGNTQRFTVWNTAAVRDTFSTAIVCSGAASACTVSPTIIQLDADASGVVTVTHNASSTVGSTGVVWLKAWKTSNAIIRDSSWTSVTVTAGPPPGVVVVNGGAALERDLCVTIAAGSDAAYECGDLRLVHALPATRTRDRARVPTLVYSSQHASQYPLVAAEVTLPSGIATPDSVTAKLRIGGVLLAQGKWPGSDWQTVWAYRIAVGFPTDTVTGVYGYTLEVTRWKNDTGTNVGTPSGELVVVNRRTSPFGAGWWLAGLEQLNVGTMVWTGGDGSLRRYTAAGTNTWVAPNMDRPDTLKWDGTYYTRYLRNGLKVRFNAQGRHVETVTRLNQVTRFTYDGAGRLDSLILPPAGSGKFYRFVYNASTARLDSIIAPPIGAQARATRVTPSGTRITALRDPDARSVSFTYGTGADSNRVVRRTNRRGFTTHYRYDAGKRLTRDSLPLDAGFIAKTYRASESRGVAGTPAVRYDTAYTLLDGPRTDRFDITRFWINVYGAPTRIRNASGGQTRIIYDATWPALAATLIAPNGFETRAYYNARGLIDSTVALNPVGTGANARTRYQWHPTWDMVTQVTSPTGLVTTLSYDATGNRLWQQPGSDASRRVTFSYWPSEPQAGLLATVTAPLTPAESLIYNGLGNLSRTRTPIGFTTLIFSDAVGRDTLVRSPIDSATGRDSAGVVATGSRVRTVYDGMDRVVQTVSWGPSRVVPGRTLPADSVRVVNGYDDEGNVTNTTRYYPSALTSTWTYDAADRVTEQSSPGLNPERYTLDPAGNVTSTLTPRGLTITANYDALNRVIKRVVPQVTYPNLVCPLYYVTIPPLGCQFTFPTRNGPQVCLRADTAKFGYDGAGNLVRADNWAARIRRSYAASGLLSTDTLRVRTYHAVASGPCEQTPPEGGLFDEFERHVYPLRITYDLDGRRDTLFHPDSVDPCVGRCWQRYSYHPVTGQLTSVRDILGYIHAFAYDVAGRLRSQRAPGNWPDSIEYDNDSRVTWRQVWGYSADQLSYDALGRVVSGSIGNVAGGGPQPVSVYYGPLRAVARAEGLSRGSTFEEFETDPLGNRRWQRDFGVNPSYEDRRRRFTFDAVARVTRINVEPPTPNHYQYEQTTEYDLRGNVFKTYGYEPYQTPEGWSRWEDQAISYYGADDQLRIYNRHLGVGLVSAAGGVYEEYRYDALGRRVLVRSRCTGDQQAASCQSYVQRTVWDGDQVLYEIRAKGKDGTLAHEMEFDNAGALGPENVHGRVAYVHAAGIDRPVSLVRMGLYSGATVAIAPHVNWQGDAEIGSCMDGQPTTTCYPQIDWPGGTVSVDGEPAFPGPYHWFGNLITQHRDGSGLQYLRNRYYDPKTGRFTQEDPIGLAGGLNLYGFANGDPVNFNDPFGLCASDGGAGGGEGGGSEPSTDEDQDQQKPPECQGRTATLTSERRSPDADVVIQNMYAWDSSGTPLATGSVVTTTTKDGRTQRNSTLIRLLTGRRTRSVEREGKVTESRDDAVSAQLLDRLTEKTAEVRDKCNALERSKNPKTR
jgi:RHS repeat-associated protein